MKQKKQFLVILMIFFSLGVTLQAQVKVKGQIINEKDKVNLSGVLITVLPETENLNSKSITTNFDGTFLIKSQITKGSVKIEFLGYETALIKFDAGDLRNIDLGVISLREEIIKQITVNTSSIDVVKDRKTPIASSTILGEDLRENIGNKDLVETANNVSGIYTSRAGGGFGDSRMSIRGFRQNDLAPMVDGIPLYDLENGAVDWTGLFSINDAASSVQIQKGLGASKLVNSSVAGTVNMILRESSAAKGGYISNTTGNDGFNKFIGSFGTGKLENGFSTNLVLSQIKGEGYVNQTSFKALSYYLAFGYNKGKHDLQLKIFGAPQWHNQRKTAISLMDYLGSYDPKLFNKITPKYNKDWGYLNGDAYNTKTNYGHKPISILQWDWDIVPSTQLSTKLYASIGSSGKTALEGGVAGFADYTAELGPNWNYNLYGVDNNNDVTLNLDNNLFYDSNNQLELNRLKAYNTGNYAYFINVIPADFFYRWNYDGKFYNSSRSADVLYDRNANKDYGNANATGISLVSHVTDQKIYGSVINLRSKISDKLIVNLGLDGRSTNYSKRKILSDLFGADAYWVDILVKDKYNPPYDNYQGLFMNENQNLTSDTYNPKTEYLRFKSRGQSLEYNYNAKIKYLGSYAQLEYDIWKLSFLLQGGYNKQFVERVDNKAITAELKSTGQTNLEGYNLKGGMNFNISQKNNLWINYGIISRPPVFVTVYSGFDNVKNKYYKNQKFNSLEAGYGFRTKYFAANVNGYISSDKGFEEPYFRQDYGNVGGIANIEKTHKGVEVELLANVTSRLSLKGALSYGDWKYSNNAEYRGYDKGEIFETQVLNIKNMNVGGAPQRMASISGGYRLFSGFNFGGEFKYSDRIFSSAPLWQYSTRYGNRTAPVELPGFGVVNGFTSYKFNIHSAKQAVELRFNMDNLLNRLYMSESNSSVLPSDLINSNPANGTFQSNNYLYKGVPTTNTVLFGFGRTWNFTVKYEF